jgi:hypothetical protein
VVASRLQQLKPKIARTNLEPADVEALKAAFASATRAAAPDPGPEQAGQADG